MKSIFWPNGYLKRILDKAFNQNEKDKPVGPAKYLVYLKHSWIGQISETFGQSIKLVTEQTFFVARFVGIVSTKTILPPTHKESLPASSSSCVVYEFKCEYGSRCVGRTDQRLSDRIKQHVPSVIRNKTQPSRQQPERQCRSSQLISRESAVVKHLLSNRSCAETYSDDNFKILYKCRSAFQLKVMEVNCIKFNDPDVCRQKEFVLQLVLFWPSRIPLGRCHLFFWDYISRWFVSLVSRRTGLDKWSSKMHRAFS